MVMTLDQALRQSEPRVGAWDYESDEVGTLRIYFVSQSGATLLAIEQVPGEERERLNDRLRELGLRIGGTHRDQDFIWVMDNRGAAIYSSRALIARGTSTELVVGESVTPRATIAGVETWFDPHNIGHRGVRVVRVDGTSVVVVEERSKSHQIDPTYGMDSLDRDIEWAFFLGQDLALWLDVPHRDQVSDNVTNEWMRSIAGRCRALATRVEQTIEIGMFEPNQVSLGPYGRAADLSLRFGPDPDDRGHRCLEVLATSKAGTTSERSVKRGTNAQIAACLRQIRTPAMILTVMLVLFESQ